MNALRTALTISGLLLCLSTRAASAAAPGDWPGWQGPNRDGKSLDTGLLKQWPEAGPKLLWKADNVGSGFSSIAVADGIVYTAGDAGGQFTVFAFDMSGRPKWQQAVCPAAKVQHPGARSTPVIDAGRLYIVSCDGLVACYDAKAGGEPKWTRRMREFGGKSGSWGYSESVLIYKDLAIVTPGRRNCIVALDKATGKTVWTSTGFSGTAGYGSCIAVTLEGVEMIIAGTADGIVGVSAKDGRTLWSNDFCRGNTANCPTPAYADGYVFWANGYGKGGICLKLAVADGKVTATEAWKTRDMNCHHGGYVIEKGYIYGNNGGGWACLKLEDGTPAWRERGVGKGSVCFADGMLYLFSERNGEIGLAPATPEGLNVVSRFRVAGSGPSWAHPVVTGGRLYLRYDTNLYCFDVKAPSAATAPAP